MKLTKGTSSIVVSTLEDMVKLHNQNMHSVAIDFAKLAVKQRRSGRLAGLAIIGVGALWKITHDLSKDQARLKEEVRTLKAEIDSSNDGFNSDMDDIWRDLE